MEMKFLTLEEFQEANRRAIRAKCNSIDSEYVKTLPGHFRYPIFFTLPYERQGWVRCQVGTCVSGTESDYVPCLLDVPQDIFDGLGNLVVDDDEIPEAVIAVLEHAQNLGFLRWVDDEHGYWMRLDYTGVQLVYRGVALDPSEVESVNNEMIRWFGSCY